MKANRELEPELALAITQKLKKAFAKSRNNLLQLDESLSVAFKEKFPDLVSLKNYFKTILKLSPNLISILP